MVSAKRDETSDEISFDYLLSMPLYSLTKEKVQELEAKIVEKRR